MLSVLLNRLGNLLCVKSIVTIVLTVVFACLALSGKITGQDFLTVFSVVIAESAPERKADGNDRRKETDGQVISAARSLRTESRRVFAAGD